MDKYIDTTTKSVESLKLNTGVAALMTALNEFGAAGVSRNTYGIFLKLLHPFAPHITSELAAVHKIDLNNWPSYDPSKLKLAITTVAVQVNGKTRTTVELSADAPEDAAVAAAEAAAGKWLAGPTKKVIYRPGKVINLII